MQFRLPVTHGVAIVPEVVSLKTQVGAGPVLELQLDEDCLAARL